MLRKLSSFLIRWFHTAFACCSDLYVMPISRSQFRRLQFCSFCFSHGRVVMVDPPPAESLGEQVGPLPMPKSEAQADGHTSAC